MSYRVRYTAQARADLHRLHAYWLQHDVAVARRALATIKKGIELLKEFPFTCRKVDAEFPLVRELLIPFSSAGYIVLFHIDGPACVTIMAVRHQREEDYH